MEKGVYRVTTEQLAGGRWRARALSVENVFGFGDTEEDALTDFASRMAETFADTPLPPSDNVQGKEVGMIFFASHVAGHIADSVNCAERGDANGALTNLDYASKELESLKSQLNAHMKNMGPAALGARMAEEIRKEKGGR